MDVKLVVVFAAIVFVCVSAHLSPTPEERNYLREILKPIELEERRQALIHQLYLGYVKKHPKLPNFNIPIEDTLRIFDIVSRNFRIPAVKGKICFPSGECIDPDDPGIIP